MSEEIQYITPRQWAKEHGRSFQRAAQVLQAGPLPPGVLRIRLGKTYTYAIPEGTPWPERKADELPEGTLSTKAWAAKVGKTRNAAQFMMAKHGPPPGTERYSGNRFAIPEGAPWVYPPRGRPRRPFNFGHGRPQ